MDSKTFREVALSYAAVYNQNLREELEEKQDFENWIDSLLEEGYDLSDYTWEDMYEAYIGERVITAQERGLKPAPTQPLKPLPQAKPLSGQRGDGSGYKDRTGKTEGPLITANPGNPEEARKALEKTKQKPHTRTGNPTRIMSPNLSTTRQVDAVRGMVQGRAINNPTASSLPRGSSAKPPVSREIIRRPQAEQVDVYDLILSHLLDEGYANSVDAAEKIMVNMSEEWRESIVEDIRGAITYNPNTPIGRLKRRIKGSTPEKREARTRSYQGNKSDAAERYSGSQYSPYDDSRGDIPSLRGR